MCLAKYYTSFFALLLLYASCGEPKNNPEPNGDTVVHENGEDGDSYAARMKWIELMHGGENSGWRNIEAIQQDSIYQLRAKKEISLRSEDEFVAGGNIFGKWIERGSNNNAGNIMVVDYDAATEEVYAVGGGGPIFKGDLTGTNWTLINDKLRFSTNLLKVFTMANGVKRIVSAINGIPHYSDDGGKVWLKSTGVISTTDGYISFAQTTTDGTIFFLGKRDYWADLKVYASFDMGKTYQSLKTFSTSDSRNIALTQNGVNGDIYVIEQIGVSDSKIHKFMKNSKKLELIVSNTSIGFGSEGRANLQAVSVKDSVFMYAFTEDSKLLMSKNEGQSWFTLSSLPKSPWDMGLYVCPSNPKIMFFGEVDAYRSTNGGLFWSRVNNWWEYYDDIYGKLHADMMTIKEFKDLDGRPFILNGNHGGLYYSNDYGKTHINIGLAGLNVSQYYDVRTYPDDPYYVFAGSQDQGQQRGILSDEQASELEQNISGDYGHIEFTGNGKSLWSVYPGGSIGYYSIPKQQNGPIAGYEIKSENETVWIPPIMPGPDPTKNIIIAAGGSISESSKGSHLLQLEYVNGNITAKELPFDFSASGGQISAMAINPFNKAKWYVATTNGYFYISEDAGKSFSRTVTMLSESHYLYGSCILPSTKNPDVVYLSGNGYRYNPVYKSTDGGRTFKSFSSGLPSTMVFNIVANEDESLIFAATESGPYVYVASKEKWFSLHGDFSPNQTYWSVEYVPQIKTARFATYGRGIWDFEVKEIISSVNAPIASGSVFKVYPNPAGSYINIDGISEYLFVPVTITNANGQVIKQVTAVPGASIAISNLAPGTYYVSTIFKGTKYSEKVIKQ